MTRDPFVQWLLTAVFLLSLCTGGCGSSQSSGRPDIDAIPDEEHYGGAVKASLYEFRAKVRKRGVQAAQQEVPQLLESLGGYEQQPLGDHAATYKEIVEKVKALQGSLGSANRDAVIKAADEIGVLADKLPGKANPNPEVE